MTDRLKLNASLVEALGSALREGDHSLGTVPSLIKRVLREESWREFVTQRGEHVVHERFADFVVQQPLRGIGADVALVRRVVETDTDALDLFDRALQERHGGDRRSAGRIKDDNVKLDQPDGNSRLQALRRLRDQRPDLHAEVLAGRLTAHGAMVRAGFRRKTTSVPLGDTAKTAEALRRHLSAQQVEELVKLLSGSGE